MSCTDTSSYSLDDRTILGDASDVNSRRTPSPSSGALRLDPQSPSLPRSSSNKLSSPRLQHLDCRNLPSIKWLAPGGW